MRYQSTSYSCGAAAVLNASRCFGKRTSERMIRSVAETTPDGTDDLGIVKALNTIGLVGYAFEEIDPDQAIYRIREELRWLNPTIICTQNLQHWVLVAAGTDNFNRYMIIDSARTQKNIKENGIHILSEKELKQAWQTRQGLFFGIHVARKKYKKK